ncbi:MAG: DUF6132 family protein [Bacteroidota bacterium]
MNFPKARKYLPIVIGAAGGYLYYKFIGCTTGSCPITSNPFSSMLYGAFIGFLTRPDMFQKIKKEV